MLLLLLSSSLLLFLILILIFSWRFSLLFIYYIYYAIFCQKLNGCFCMYTGLLAFNSVQCVFYLSFFTLYYLLLCFLFSTLDDS